MFYFRLILLFSVALFKFSDAVQINMHGSLSLGREVMDTISHFVVKNYKNGRRSFNKIDYDDNYSDTISLLVKSAFLCRDISFCKDIEPFLNKYIIKLTRAVETIFEGLIHDVSRRKSKDQKQAIFEDGLKKLIRDIKILLKSTDRNIKEEKKAYLHIDLLKKLNAMIQDASIAFASKRLEGNVDEVSEVKKKLTQKIIIATSLIELDFVNQLCVNFDICAQSHECTTASNSLLLQLQNLTDAKIKEFIRSFYVVLPDTEFYSHISDVTANEFQTILHDMSFTDNIPTKNVLATVQQSVEERVKAIATKTDEVDSRDVKLVHIILSDMDHFYSKHNKEPFFDFFNDLYEWSQSGDIKLTSSIRQVMRDVTNVLALENDDLVLKLVNEVRVFMEITVDPVKNK